MLMMSRKKNLNTQGDVIFHYEAIQSRYGSDVKIHISADAEDSYANTRAWSSGDANTYANASARRSADANTS